MVKKEVEKKEIETISKVTALNELIVTLKKDEEAFKHNLLALQSQLQYNLGIQKAIQVLINQFKNSV